ncbi:NAD(P)H-hydrate epimerase [Malassezia yamatoensis]|uniref:NAD(P)H-hydrate epimerase n=1 Tax=Malassezia yamatoensis TaxID=253288 RepID=A0AAJ6CL01_9BASI|nr:NAD(P)H-hydrate epimerase [Malassezia yamatoensis]
MSRIRYVTSGIAQRIDQDLMSSNGGFSIDQLMELAGFSCAEAVYRSYPPNKASNKVLVACGPGNQGGDGLVAARHLYHFGYTPKIWYPKRKDAPLFHGLVKQLENLSIEFVPDDKFSKAVQNETDIVLDSIFGFSFHGEPREPFLTALQDLIHAQNQHALKVVSVDIPSSWNVDQGQSTSEIAKQFNPNVLVSLTAPKSGSKAFSGEKHWLGGRFVDPTMGSRYDLRLPKYPDTSQVVDITGYEAVLD